MPTDKEWDQEIRMRMVLARRLVRQAWPGELGERIVDQLGGDDMDSGSEFLFALETLVRADNVDPVVALRRTDVQSCLNLGRNVDQWLARGIGHQIK